MLEWQGSITSQYLHPHTSKATFPSAQLAGTITVHLTTPIPSSSTRLYSLTYYRPLLLLLSIFLPPTLLSQPPNLARLPPGRRSLPLPVPSHLPQSSFLANAPPTTPLSRHTPDQARCPPPRPLDAGVRGGVRQVGSGGAGQAVTVQTWSWQDARSRQP
ncbi:hypothetical protein Pcinc_036498 [Petrolisthes cinctipes]|uniref:Uncharacterized protein n=1 Tax=Petrolisthes cinctipes TaxID=88211 RepID=A0AAE1BVJ3_PETCI|nr:hypothetical protein Pcinc_036498 [Petrolisthes cinctipes]